MGHAQAGRTQPGYRPEPGGDHRDHGQVVDHVVPAGVHGHVSEAGHLQRFHAAAPAGALHEPHDGHPQLAGQLLGVDLLGDDGRVGGAAADRDVVAAHHDLAPDDAPGAGHEVGRGEAVQRPVAVVAGLPGQLPDLPERPVVEQPPEPLAHRQPPGVMLPGDLLRPAHPPGQFPPPRHFAKFRVPRHAAEVNSRTRFTYPAPRAGCGAWRWRVLGDTSGRDLREETGR